MHGRMDAALDAPGQAPKHQDVPRLTLRARPLGGYPAPLRAAALLSPPRLHRCVHTRFQGVMHGRIQRSTPPDKPYNTEG